MTSNDAGNGSAPEKKPWGRSPLKPWVYWTIVVVAVAIVVAVIVITTAMGKFV